MHCTADRPRRESGGKVFALCLRTKMEMISATPKCSFDCKHKFYSFTEIMISLRNQRRESNYHQANARAGPRWSRAGASHSLIADHFLFHPSPLGLTFALSAVPRSVVAAPWTYD